MIHAKCVICDKETILCRIVHIYSPTTGEIEAEEESHLLGQPGLHSKILSSITSNRILLLMMMIRECVELTNN